MTVYWRRQRDREREREKEECCGCQFRSRVRVGVKVRNKGKVSLWPEGDVRGTSKGKYCYSRLAMATSTG